MATTTETVTGWVLWTVTAAMVVAWIVADHTDRNSPDDDEGHDDD